MGHRGKHQSLAVWRFDGVLNQPDLHGPLLHFLREVQLGSDVLRHLRGKRNDAFRSGGEVQPSDLPILVVNDFVSARQERIAGKDIPRKKRFLIVARDWVPHPPIVAALQVAQALDALNRLNQIANAVICFENDRMGDLVSPKAGIHQAFAVADVTISQSVRSIVNLIQRPGIIRIGFDDLLAALRSPNGRCLFGFGESDSDNRAHDALNQALKSPLMDRGRLLADAEHVLVQVAGGPAMTLSEVEILMQEFGRHVHDHTQIMFGTAVDSRMGNRLSVTIISSLATEDEVAPVEYAPAIEPLPEPTPAPVLEPKAKAPVETPPPIPEPVSVEEETPPPDLIPFAQPAAVEVPPPPMVVPPPPVEPSVVRPEPGPRLIIPKKKPAIVKEAKPEKVQAKQEVLQFEPVSRGRFEKSEPTIVEGQDLDVPTFLRKNIRVK